MEWGGSIATDTERCSYVLEEENRHMILFPQNKQIPCGSGCAYAAIHACMFAHREIMEDTNQNVNCITPGE